MPTVNKADALIGRDSELAMLDVLLTEAAAGRGGPVLIEGERGIGKSSLVRSVPTWEPATCERSWPARAPGWVGGEQR